MKIKGFTLIELVVVIVIIGILATTAAPKFLGLTTDAKNATLSGVKAALVSAANLAKGKLALDGLEDKPSVISITEPSVEKWCAICGFNYGYPSTLSNTWTYIADGIGFGDSNIYVGVNKADEVVFSFNENIKDGILQTEKCYLKYTPATETTSYKFEQVDC